MKIDSPESVVGHRLIVVSIFVGGGTTYGTSLDLSAISHAT